MIVTLTTERSVTLNEPAAVIHSRLVRLLNNTGGTLGTTSDSYVDAAFGSAVKAWSLGSALVKTADLLKRAEVQLTPAGGGYSA